MRGSRLLNERQGLLGLEASDFIGVVVVYSLSMFIFGEFNLEILSFPIAGLAGISLIHIRRSYRRHIIRDVVLGTAREIYRFSMKVDLYEPRKQRKTKSR